MIYFIVNLKSKTGVAADTWNIIKGVLREEDVQYKAFRTKYPGHAMKLAEKISALSGKEIRLVVVGGDGTVNEVLNGITDFSKVSLGIVPSGSGNDFARGLGIKQDPETAIRKIVADKERSVIDLGSVRYDNSDKPRYFGISSGVGLDAIVCKKANSSKQKAFLNRFGLGKLTYLLLTVETLFSMRHVRGEVSFDGDKSKRFDKLIFAAAMNLPAEGGGVPMAPDANPRDGHLTLCLAHDVRKLPAFFALPWLCVGKHDRLKCFYLRDFGNCLIRLEKPVTLHGDGENLGEVREICFEIHKGKLQLLHDIHA